MHDGRLLVRIIGLLGLLAVSGLSSGCALKNSFLDPTKVGEFPSEYQVRGIRRVLTPRDNPSAIANAEAPVLDDLTPVYEDYRIAPSDILQLVVDDLVSPGLAETTVQQVSNTGYIRLPILGSILVAGMTELEVEQEITRRLREDGLLPTAIVRATLQQRSARYNMLGSVGRAGAYPLNDPNLRLLDAIGLAQDIGADTREIYVIRRQNPRYEDLIDAPPPTRRSADDLVVPPPTEEDFGGAPLYGGAYGDLPANDVEAETLEEIITPESTSRTTDDTMIGLDPIIFDPETGKPMTTAPKTRAAEEQPTTKIAESESRRDTDDGEFQWDDVPEYETQQRVIRIDVRKLNAGDPSQNIIIRDQDVVRVPIDTGVFYMMGEINRPGVFAFGGREITLKQAIALAAGFTPLAWPQNCEIIRREPGTDTQTVVPVNLDLIFAGREDDVLLRNEDIVNVGTHWVSPFLFVIRNSFRFTYGFGFVYDRNFADVDAYSSKANPTDVKRSEKASRGLLF